MFIKKLLLVSNCACLALLFSAVWIENASPSWKPAQWSYASVLRTRADKGRGGVSPKFPIRLRQIVLPELNRVDRCITCHVGIEDPGAANLPQPLAVHPGGLLDDHDVDDYGCTICHEGKGSATTTAKDGHGELKYWISPMRRGAFVQASCLRCHEDTERLQGAQVLARGKSLFKKSGCADCHVAKGYEATGKVGPKLDGIGHKVNRQWLIAWLKKPRSYLPKANMPDFFLSDEEASDMANFLLSLQGQNTQGAVFMWPSWASKPFEKLGDDEFDAVDELMSKGKGVWGQARCSICHARKGVGGGAKLGPDLGGIVSKVNRSWLLRWIRNPRSINPQTQMPHYRFSDGQLRALVEFIVRDAKFGAKIEGAYPALQTTFPVAAGDKPSIARGRQLVEHYYCNGCHAISGFPAKLKLADLSSYGSKPVGELDFGKLARKLPHTRTVWLMEKLRNPRGFSEGLKMPGFGFSKENRVAITTFLLGMTGENVDESYRVRRPAQQFVAPGEFGGIVADINCFACHRMNGRGGTYAPDLSGEGSMVRREWLQGFLRKPDVLRPMLQQMPNFNLTAHEVAVLAEYMGVALADPRIPYDLLPHAPSAAEVDKGQAIYQQKGCVACHQIGPTGGALGPLLTDVSDRLEPGYIFRYLKDPQSLRPDAVEPNYGLNDEDAMSLTTFLHSLKGKAKK